MEYRIIRMTNLFSTSALKREVEREINLLAEEGWDIVSVSFSFTAMLISAAFITIKRSDKDTL